MTLNQGEFIAPGQVKFVGRKGSFMNIGEEKLALVREVGTDLMGVIDSDYRVVVPLIFYDTIDYDLTRLSRDTYNKRPEFAMQPTWSCRGWGRVFINRNMDIRFDLGSQEEFYEKYPEGREWVKKYLPYLANEWRYPTKERSNPYIGLNP